MQKLTPIYSTPAEKLPEDCLSFGNSFDELRDFRWDLGQVTNLANQQPLFSLPLTALIFTEVGWNHFHIKKFNFLVVKDILQINASVSSVYCDT